MLPNSFMSCIAVFSPMPGMRDIDAALARSALLLAVIGPRWADATNGPRLADPQDMVEVPGLGDRDFFFLGIDNPQRVGQLAHGVAEAAGGCHGVWLILARLAWQVERASGQATRCAGPRARAPGRAGS